jgi:uncharacterized membrane protein
LFVFIRFYVFDWHTLNTDLLGFFLNFLIAFLTSDWIKLTEMLCQFLILPKKKKEKKKRTVLFKTHSHDIFCLQIKFNLRYWLVARISSEISCISHLIFSFHAQSKEFCFCCWYFITLYMYIYTTSSYRHPHKHKLYRYMLPWINLCLNVYLNIYNVWCVLL